MLSIPPKISWELHFRQVSFNETKSCVVDPIAFLLIAKLVKPSSILDILLNQSNPHRQRQSASLINLVCAIYGFKFQTMPVFILVNDNQTKLLFLQPQIRNYLAFLFLHLVHYSFILHFSSRWLDIFLISCISVNAESITTNRDPSNGLFFHRVSLNIINVKLCEKCQVSWIFLYVLFFTTVYTIDMFLLRLFIFGVLHIRELFPYYIFYQQVFR